MCNVFKPDRCHHCSVCNKCNLNMDHHCPWVNNCIGFWNRKYFLLLLFYTVTTLLYYLLTMLSAIIDTIYWHLTVTQKDFKLEKFATAFALDATFLFSLFLIVILTKFAYFHVTLVMKNMTTLESLEHKGTNFDNLLASFVRSV